MTAEREPFPQEIERAFLVTSLPENVHRFPHDQIRQGYLVVAKDKSEVRLRQIGPRRLLTFKGPGKLERREIEVELSDREFDRLWPATESRRVNKTRYRIKHMGHTIELDVFEDDLEGLVVAEVEFHSVSESQNFAPPVWFNREVTQDARYKNQNLAQHGVPDPGQ